MMEKKMIMYGIKWENKETKKSHIDSKVYKRKCDANRQVNKYVALGNENWEITVVEVEECPCKILNPITGKYDEFMRWYEITK